MPHMQTAFQKLQLHKMMRLNWLTQKTLTDSMVISGWTISIAHLGKVTQLQVPILDNNDPYQIG